jgi:hypothetical protein
VQRVRAWQARKERRQPPQKRLAVPLPQLLVLRLAL